MCFRTSSNSSKFHCFMLNFSVRWPNTLRCRLRHGDIMWLTSVCWTVELRFQFLVRKNALQCPGNSSMHAINVLHCINLVQSAHLFSTEQRVNRRRKFVMFPNAVHDCAHALTYKAYKLVRFEVFTAMTMKNGVLWDATPCGSCKNRRFGGT
jgi:hypothetical protein